MLEFAGKIVPGTFLVDPESDPLAFRLEKRFGLLEAKRNRELAVVAEMRVDVEGKMSAVERQIVAQNLVEQGAAPPRDRLGAGPEQSVVDDGEIYARRNCCI